uniref:PEP-CTERM sorting domain-containing protein n=1 Tax=Aquabacterium sp. UBA2148 TaxID=1946042 RepID=UPI002580CE8A
APPPGRPKKQHLITPKVVAPNLNRETMSKFFALSAPLAALAIHASAGAVTIDFDTLAGGPIWSGEQVTTQYQSLGVTFEDSHSGGARANNTLTGLIAGASAPNVLWVDQGGGSTTGQYLDIDFTSSFDRVDVLFGTSLSADFTLQAYGQAGLLGSINLTGDTVIGDIRSGQASLSLNGITSLRMFSLSGSRSFNFSIDNLVTSSVPEPTSLALTLVGLAAVGATAARKRK